MPVLDFARTLPVGGRVSLHLAVSLTTANVDIVVSSQFQTEALPRVYIAIPFQGSLEILYEPHWDVQPLQLGANAFLKAILIKQRFSKSTRDTEDCVILARQCGDSYERVGIFWFLPHMGGVIDMFKPDVHMCDTSFRPVSTELRIKHQRPWGLGRWWREAFKEETLRLG